MQVRLPIGLKVEDTVVTEIEIKELDGFSRQIIADKELKKNQARLTTALLKHCIVSIGGKAPAEEQIRHMFVTDRNSVIVYLQKHSIGNEIKTRYICPWCEAGFDLVEDLSTLEFTQWEDWKNEIEIDLPKGYTDKDGNTHSQLVLGIPTGYDEEILNSVLARNYGEWCNALIARKVKSFGSLDMNKFSGLGVKIIQALSLKDIDAIIQAMTMNMPGFGIKHVVACSSCGRDSQQILDMSYFF
jgi:hypothetical protein